MQHVGELAAFGTAVCWTISALFFERSSKRVGALAVNFYKVLIAFFLLGISAWATRGMPLPLDAPARAWIYLPVSGLIGFVIADTFLFNAYILISSRITVIFQALTPLFTFVLGYLILGETMRPIRLLAMALVVAGIALVVGAKNGPAREHHAPRPRGAARGYVYAFLSALFQACGLVFTKLGLGDYNAVSGTQIRVMTAVAGFALQAIILRQGRAVFRSMRDRHALQDTSMGAFFGPFLGVVFSLVALQKTSAGAASTLMALTPVLIILPSVLFFKQRVRIVEVVGAAVAVAGAALFFLI
ncbi:MAG TPA: DMT family transporter [Rectinemataceae bacterium]|nr:DMT family transporter [Rectinemataceae bacterium]